MRSMLLGSLVCLMALGLAATAWGEGAIPWAGGEKATTDTPAATTAAPAADTGTPAAGNEKADKQAAPVKDMMARADKLLKSAGEELAKPEDKRDTKKANNMKLNAGQAYMGAAQKAKSAAILITKAEDKQAFLDQYEKPNKEKAIGIYTELAEAARAKKDYKEAVSLYKLILQIDPKNEAATAALKAMDEEIKTAAKTAKDNLKGGGGTDGSQIKEYQKGYKADRSGYTSPDYGRTGRSY